MSTLVKEWRVIEKAPNYEISNCGEVRNKTTNRILKQTFVGCYLTVGVRENNKTITLFIHRLVATGFIVCINETYIVNHKDGVKTNNNVSNLEWVSLSENSKHAFRLGLNKANKYKVSQYALDGVFIKEYESCVDVEKETGISNGLISRVCRGSRGKKSAGGYIWKYSEYIALEEQPKPEGKILPDYPNYIITREGTIYNLQKKQYLYRSSRNCRYVSISLHNGQKRGIFNVHRLVALLYIENPYNYPEVNHKDSNKKNNNVDNLEWITRSDNMKHMFNAKRDAVN